MFVAENWEVTVGTLFPEFIYMGLITVVRTQTTNGKCLPSALSSIDV